VNDGTGLAEALLGLPGFRVLEVTETPVGLVIRVETTASLTGCGGCDVRAQVHDRVDVAAIEPHVSRASREQCGADAGNRRRRHGMARRQHRGGPVDVEQRRSRLAGHGRPRLTQQVRIERGHARPPYVVRSVPEVPIEAQQRPRARVAQPRSPVPNRRTGSARIERSGVTEHRAGPHWPCRRFSPRARAGVRSRDRASRPSAHAGQPVQGALRSAVAEHGRRTAETGGRVEPDVEIDQMHLHLPPTTEWQLGHGMLSTANRADWSTPAVVGQRSECVVEPG
jgi:hypothetical protein